MQRINISTHSIFEEQVSYSRAVAVGNMVFVSGCTGYDYESMQISEDIAEQTQQCFVNIKHALAKANASMEDVVRVTYILSDATLFEACWPVIRNHFESIRPAATAFEARLLNDKMKIEIEVTAFKNS